jgi:hypothetical protein
MEAITRTESLSMKSNDLPVDAKKNPKVKSSVTAPARPQAEAMLMPNLHERVLANNDYLHVIFVVAWHHRFPADVIAILGNKLRLNMTAFGNRDFNAVAKTLGRELRGEGFLQVCARIAGGFGRL